MPLVSLTKRVIKKNLIIQVPLNAKKKTDKSLSHPLLSLLSHKILNEGRIDTQIIMIQFAETAIPTPISAIISTRKIQHIGPMVIAKGKINNIISKKIKTWIAVS